jgi:pilus assembly protein Flp/PilA
MGSFAAYNSHHTEVEVTTIALAARRFIKDEEGAALAEYGILVAFIAIVAITAVTFFGSKISAKFSSLATSFS